MMINRVIESINEYRLTVLSGEKWNQLNILLAILEELGITQNEPTLLCNMMSNSIWFTTNLISFMSGLDRNQVQKFFYPCARFNKEKETFAKDIIANSVEKIHQSNLYMEDYESDEEGYEITLDDFEYKENRMFPYVIINDFDSLLSCIKEAKDEILTKLYNWAKYENMHIIIVSDIKKEVKDKTLELTDIDYYEDFKGLVDNFILTWNDDKEKEKFKFMISNRDSYNNYSWE